MPIQYFPPGSVTTGGGLTAEQLLLLEGAEQTANKNQANGYVGMDASGDIVGVFIPRYDSFTTIGAIVLNSGEIATDYQYGTMRIGDGSTAGGRNITLSSYNSMYVGATADPTGNGIELAAAYLRASGLVASRTLTEAEPFWLIVGPGKWNLQAQLACTIPWLNIIGVDKYETVVTAFNNAANISVQTTGIYIGNMSLDPAAGVTTGGSINFAQVATGVNSKHILERIRWPNSVRSTSQAGYGITSTISPVYINIHMNDIYYNGSNLLQGAGLRAHYMSGNYTNMYIENTFPIAAASMRLPWYGSLADMNLFGTIENVVQKATGLTGHAITTPVIIHGTMKNCYFYSTATVTTSHMFHVSGNETATFLHNTLLMPSATGTVPHAIGLDIDDSSASGYIGYNTFTANHAWNPTGITNLFTTGSGYNTW